MPAAIGEVVKFLHVLLIDHLQRRRDDEFHFRRPIAIRMQDAARPTRAASRRRTKAAKNAAGSSASPAAAS